jgi:hypothetical protein
MVDVLGVPEEMTVAMTERQTARDDPQDVLTSQLCDELPITDSLADLVAQRQLAALHAAGYRIVRVEDVMQAIDNGLDDGSDASTSMTLAAQMLRPYVRKWVSAAIAGQEPE